MKKGKLLAITLLTLAMGCSAEDPGFETGPDAGFEEPTPGVVPLNLDPIQSLTPFDTVKVTGQGPAGGILSIDAVGKRLEPKTINADGSFCIDVPLVAGANKIRFEAIDADGNVSESIFKDVTREGDIPDPEGEGTEGRIVSASKDATLLSSGGYDLQDGTVEGNLVDEVASVFSIEEDAWGDTFVAFDMGEPTDIHGFRMISDTGCFPTNYEVYVSSVADPFANDDSVNGNTAWQLLVDVNGTGTADDQFAPNDPEWVFSTATPSARHFAIRLNTSDCGDLFWDNFRIINAYMLTMSDGTEPPPAPSADMCVQ